MSFKKSTDIVLYYMEKKPDGTVSLYSGYMRDRHKLWVEHPKANEITKKQYDALLEYLKGSDKMITTNQLKFIK
jgi:hypothetical protein